MLPSNQKLIIEQAKFNYSLQKAFEKQIKAIGDQGKNKLRLWKL